MVISVTGRHIEISDDIRAYAEAKGGKLPRFFDRISAIDFVLDHQSDQLTAEVIVKADRTQDFVARESGPDPLALIDLIVDKVERQLTKHKEKTRDHRHPAAKETPEET